MKEVSFTVAAVAEPQGSVQAFLVPAPGTKFGCRAILTSDNPDLKAYRRIVTARALTALEQSGFPQPLAGKHIAVALEVRFTFLKPPSVKASRTQMVVRPDVDKCLRSTLDALTGILYEDDAQVVEITARKQYGPAERVDVTARILECDDLPVPQLLALVEDF